MKWSLRIARIAGIDVYLHWTFIILLGWIGLSTLANTGIQRGGMAMFWSFMMLFIFVLLHEFGHALMGRRFGVRTSSITLLPIGGVAAMERMPEKPREEFLIAAAGPAVNLVLALVLGAILFFSGTLQFAPRQLFELGPDFMQNLLAINIVLFAFNLVPAFPMDGGRMLRALLAMKYDRAKATAIAARIGQFLAIGFVFLGLYFNIWLMFVGIFIYLGAGAEASYEATHSVLARYTVRDALMHKHTVFDAGASIREAIQQLLDGQEKEFLVREEGRLIGSITRDELIAGLSQYGYEGSIGTITNRNLIYLRPDMPLEEVFLEMNQLKIEIAPVMEQDQLLGALNRENIIEMLMVANAAQQARKPDFFH
ncbi:MAG: hypothetical protein RL386_344 [Bacteroidota bacterium]|jgi:Zn-dependent protease/predicted transcriptional regulator